MTFLADPLAVKCRYCRMPAGTRCRSGRYRDCKPHAVRKRDALAVAAHSDPELGRHPFGGAGPCGLCGVQGLGARHRTVDAMAGMLAAGEDPAVVADEYRCSLDAVRAVAEWMIRWPEAWR